MGGRYCGDVIRPRHEQLVRDPPTRLVLTRSVPETFALCLETSLPNYPRSQKSGVPLCVGGSRQGTELLVGHEPLRDVEQPPDWSFVFNIDAHRAVGSKRK